MQPPHQHQRINLAELKAQIVGILGPEGSKQYFYYLNRFLSLKLSKVEFNKLCLQIVGRENIQLHNQFIRSILKNACSAKIPPPTQDKEVPKSVGAVGNKQRVPNSSVLLNGNIQPLSTQKARAETRDWKILDRPSGFGPNGKTNLVSHKPSIEHDSSSHVVLENGVVIPHEIRRPVHHHQGLMEQADWKEVFARSLLRAPLGVPSCPASVGGARKTMPLAGGSGFARSFNSGCLLDTAALRQRMEQIAALQGLRGVTMDSANLLNNGLDAYLKGLIRSCIELVGARSGHEPRNRGTNKHQAHVKPINGVSLGHHHHLQSNNHTLESIEERKLDCPISLLDFRVAMEVNPQQLGEDWPFLMEKICTRAAFEE
ncbi:Transcriptional adapter like [Actinidia chinensis var. chinensis]|uniref:Transcriptional adapter like n=1 Tax=Actinidia chinensis var. chinensis TaxID=1590841 RepID=A0A2R6PUN3_ACTCC|nr:Transcriptional adapter like [Actinidia chinensis var. chinensis]